MQSFCKSFWQTSVLFLQQSHWHTLVTHSADLIIWSIYDAMHFLTLAAHIAATAVTAQHTNMSSALYEPHLK